MKKLISAFALGTLFLTGCANLDNSIWATPAAEETANLFLSLTPGTYTGRADSFLGEIVVEVQVDASNIRNINVTSHNDTPEIADSAFEELSSLIVNRNSTGVDIIAGASASSRGFLSAVEDALVQAGADIVTLRAMGLGTGLDTFMPGTYHGEARGGFGGDIHLDVTFGRTQIEEIEVEFHAETASIAETAFPELISRALSTNSADIAVVSGATITSRAFIRALNDAVVQAIADPFAEIANEVGTGNFNFVSGTHTVTLDSMHGPFTLTLTVSENTILDIELDHVDTPMIVNAPLEDLISQVLSSQNLDLDTVTGATATTLTFIQALNLAVEQAQGTENMIAVQPTAVGQGNFSFETGNHNATVDGFNGALTVTITTTEDTIINIVVDHVDTNAFVDNPLADLIGFILQNQTTEIDSVTGATATTTAFIQALNLAVENAAQSDHTVPLDDNFVFFNPGEYSVTVNGVHGPMTLTITVDENYITNLEVDHVDNADLDDLINTVIQNQTTDLDTITGATATANIFIQALNQVVLEASTN
ncbi:MAG: FMN-binding protein [Defluviitaleaceae bacterium]|nr:FMN-binding protein [Defluviitaleaceae bacterium]